jgi:hypothetical protein
MRFSSLLFAPAIVNALAFEGAHMGELGPEIKDHGGVVNPQDDDDQGPSGTVRRDDGGLSQIETKKKLTHSEEERGCNSTLEHIALVNWLVRYILEDQGNENGDPDERDK